MAAELTIVIPAFNEASEISQTCTMLRDTAPSGTRVIVVDDGSTDGTAHAAEKVAEVVQLGNHLGASAARNAGVELADSPFVMFTDAHIVAPDDWAPPMLGLFDVFDRVGAVGPGVYNREDLTDEVYGAGMSLQTWWPIMKAGWFTPRQPIEVPIVTAGVQMWRTEVYREIGGYDADFAPIGYEDVEISLRAWRHGYSQVATPHTRFGHRFAVKGQPSHWAQHDQLAIIANELRLGVLHWTPQRLADTLSLMASDTRFNEIVRLAFSPSTLAKRSASNANGDLRPSDEWLAQSIPADQWTAARVREARDAPA